MNDKSMDYIDNKNHKADGLLIMRYEGQLTRQTGSVLCNVGTVSMDRNHISTGKLPKFIKEKMAGIGIFAFLFAIVAYLLIF